MSKIRIDGEVAYITLTKGYEAVIDVTDVPLVEGYSWTAFERRHGAVYAIAKKQVDGKRVTFLLHRVIMAAPDGITVDHRDSDPLNNRRRNLRLATQSQNAKNLRPSPYAFSSHKGVSLNPQRGKWRARISVDGQEIYLGLYETEAEAAKAYAQAAHLYHGEFARVE